MRCTALVERERNGKCIKNLVGKLKGRKYYLELKSVDGTIILKRVFNEILCELADWSNLAQVRDQ
jgi:hypothetical protein